MVSKMRYIFLMPLLVLLACGKNEFTLNYGLSPDVTENYNVNYYATDLKGGKTVQAVASVRDGKCLLNGVTKRATLVYVSANRDKHLPLLIYADRGEKIEITGNGKDPLSWKVGGNEINEHLSAWRLENFRILNENNSDSINNAVKSFVTDNPDEPVSTLLMLCYYNRKVDERGYTELMASLRGEAKEQKWLDITGRSDQMYHTYHYPARLESIILRSNKEGADTLQLNGRDAAFLLFWQTGYNERKAIVDSIKALEKGYPDSVRLLADVCLDVDSSAWRIAIRRDSLHEKTKRFWVPAGLTDSKMMKLKVPALPFYIVFDSIGSQVYRGEDLDSAMKVYRSIQPKPKK